MSKEEIQAQIDIINIIDDITRQKLPTKLRGELEHLQNQLSWQLQSAKSIKDIEREAFEAGRESNAVSLFIPKYEEFEDYLKSKET